MNFDDYWNRKDELQTQTHLKGSFNRTWDDGFSQGRASVFESLSTNGKKDSNLAFKYAIIFSIMYLITVILYETRYTYYKDKSIELETTLKIYKELCQK